MSADSQHRDTLKDALSLELARMRANELGVSPNDLIQRVIDGKSVWVLKSEAYAELDKQRKLTSSKVIRAIRGGEYSLFGLIQANIAQAWQLLEEISAEKIWNPIEQNDCHTSILTIEKRANKAAGHLTELENDIERVKQKDPIHSEAEYILGEMRKAQQEGRTEEAADISRSNADLLKRYQQRRKAIEPNIHSTHVYRQILQKVCWKIMQMVWRLRETLFDHAIAIQAASNSNQTIGSITASFVKDSQSITNRRKTLQEQYHSLVQRYPAAKDDACFDRNQALEAMKDLLQNQAELYNDCKASLTQSAESLSDNKANVRRMAFSQRKKDDGR